ncbi:MAG: glycosyltransferase family 4 protein [bacterium]|nr:glycosyltransferase family 4 protein [bacterium]
MEIWIFNHYATTPNYPGATRHFDLAKELTRRGHKVTIFSSSFHYLLLKETKQYKNSFYIVENYEDVRFVWIKTTPYNKGDWKRMMNILIYSYRAYLAGKILAKEKKPDVIIGSSVHLFAPLIAYMLSKHLVTPFILELRDIWPQALIQLGLKKYHPFIILLTIIEKFLYAKANKIISVIPNIADYLKKFGVESKAVWIPNGVDLSRVKLKEYKPNDNQTIKIAYAGSMGKVNDILIFIDLVKQLSERFSNLKIYLIGRGYDLEFLKESLKGFEKTVTFIDPVPKDKIYDVLQEFDIFLFHVADIFPYGISCNKLFDYMVIGRPIIFSANVPNNIIEEAQAGITVKERSVEKIIEAIGKIISLPEDERRKMGENARKYVEERYSIKVLADNLEKVIQEVYQNFVKK